MIVTMVIVAIEVIVAIVTQKLMFLVWIIWLHRFGDFTCPIGFKIKLAKQTPNMNLISSRCWHCFLLIWGS